MAMGAATKLRRLLRNVESVLAVEVMCATQGIDFRRPLRGSRAVEAAHAEVRSLVPALTADRVLGPDIERLALAIRQGRFATLAH